MAKSWKRKWNIAIGGYAHGCRVGVKTASVTAPEPGNLSVYPANSLVNIQKYRVAVPELTVSTYW